MVRPIGQNHGSGVWESVMWPVEVDRAAWELQIRPGGTGGPPWLGVCLFVCYRSGSPQVCGEKPQTNAPLEKCALRAHWYYVDPLALYVPHVTRPTAVWRIPGHDILPIGMPHGAKYRLRAASALCHGGLPVTVRGGVGVYTFDFAFWVFASRLQKDLKGAPFSCDR